MSLQIRDWTPPRDARVTVTHRQSLGSSGKTKQLVNGGHGGRSPSSHTVVSKEKTAGEASGLKRTPPRYLRARRSMGADTKTNERKMPSISMNLNSLPNHVVVAKPSMLSSSTIASNEPAAPTFSSSLLRKAQSRHWRNKSKHTAQGPDKNFGSIPYESLDLKPAQSLETVGTLDLTLSASSDATDHCDNVSVAASVHSKASITSVLTIGTKSSAITSGAGQLSSFNGKILRLKSRTGKAVHSMNDTHSGVIKSKKVLQKKDDSIATSAADGTSSFMPKTVDPKSEALSLLSNVISLLSADNEPDLCSKDETSTSAQVILKRQKWEEGLKSFTVNSNGREKKSSNDEQLNKRIGRNNNGNMSARQITPAVANEVITPMRNATFRGRSISRMQSKGGAMFSSTLPSCINTKPTSTPPPHPTRGRSVSRVQVSTSALLPHQQDASTRDSVSLKRAERRLNRRSLSRDQRPPSSIVYSPPRSLSPASFNMLKSSRRRRSLSVSQS